jgi:hypothetical protein
MKRYRSVHYTSFVDTSYRRMLCDAEGHVLRPMTEAEEKKWDEDSYLFGYVEFSDEEIAQGDSEIKKTKPEW